ncbi:MAG: helix-hairpin-helix domain-containing protein [Synechococcaceae cyanobacterium]|nr:helix-hairpin-helix domain-containing protein [Synechococcaceae cyanobacterium]
MASRHWLDPLARRLLIAAGQLAPPRRSPGEGGESDALERDLLALELARDPARRLRDAREVALAAELGWQLDVNRATAADWLRLPGCTPAHVDLLLRLQAGGVQLSGPEDLRALLAVSAELVRAWEPLLLFRWYDGPPDDQGARPVPVNQASPRQLEALPGLGPDRLARLVRERARQPFRDLADLQLRLRFPPAVVELWIGRVSFEPGPAGPVLPPASRPPRR